MQNNKKLWIVVLVVVVATMVTSLISFQTQGQEKPIPTNTNQKDLSQLEQQKKEFYSQFPTVQYDAPEETDPDKKAKRKLKNKRYDNRSGLVNDELPIDDNGERVLFTHFDSIAGLPASKSDIVVAGEVLDAQAYLSNNKKDVYSEFTIRVDEILKNNSTNVTQSSSINVDREGGFVRYKNGKTRLHWIGETGMPRVGQRYVLFLKNSENTPNYEIITGYELKSNGISNLDGSEQFRAYRGMDEAAFMKAVREAIAQLSPAAPKKGGIML